MQNDIDTIVEVLTPFVHAGKVYKTKTAQGWTISGYIWLGTSFSTWDLVCRELQRRKVACKVSRRSNPKSTKLETDVSILVRLKAAH